MLTPAGYNILFFAIVGIIQILLVILKVIGILTLNWGIILIPIWLWILIKLVAIVVVLWKFR